MFQGTVRSNLDPFGTVRGRAAASPLCLRSVASHSLPCLLRPVCCGCPIWGSHRHLVRGCAALCLLPGSSLIKVLVSANLAAPRSLGVQTHNRVQSWSRVPKGRHHATNVCAPCKAQV